jgi:hypothetical protein
VFFALCLTANVCDTPAKAVEKLIQENLLPIGAEDANDFRSHFLYTEEINDAFSEHIVLVRTLSATSSSRAPPDLDPWVGVAARDLQLQHGQVLQAGREEGHAADRVPRPPVRMPAVSY